jgi:hypothetical protein
LTSSSTNGAIRISYGLSRNAEAVEAGAGVVMLAIVPGDSPWFADVLPQWVVRDVRNRNEDACAFEHLRLTESSNLDALPGLDGAWRSRIRDSVTSALLAGASSVDLLLFRAAGAGPTDFAHPALREQLLPYISLLPGGLLCFPDLGMGGSRDTWRAARMLAPVLADNHMIGLLDAPADLSPEQMAEALLGTDTALCGWSDRARGMPGHTWRSAAAVVAGRMSADTAQIGRSLCRRTIPLRAPQSGPVDRWSRLRPFERAPSPLNVRAEDAMWVQVDIDEMTNAAVIRTEPALRMPVGVWTLPAMQATKAIRRAVADAAGRHLFRPVTEHEAYALAGGISSAMRPFIERGVLTGRGGVGVPEVAAAPVRNAEAPGLMAVVTGYLRPWMHVVNLRVSVRHGQAASVKEA